MSLVSGNGVNTKPGRDFASSSFFFSFLEKVNTPPSRIGRGSEIIDEIIETFDLSHLFVAGINLTVTSDLHEPPRRPHDIVSSLSQVYK